MPSSPAAIEEIYYALLAFLKIFLNRPNFDCEQNLYKRLTVKTPFIKQLKQFNDTLNIKQKVVISLYIHISRKPCLCDSYKATRGQNRTR